MAELREARGIQLGHTDWAQVSQERVNEFADATRDHQFIHVDPERAKASPFGGTIVHGYLTLILAADAVAELYGVTDAGMEVNYGHDRVRFPAPLPVGSSWRGNVEIVDVTEVSGGLQVKTKCTIEVQDQAKPACVTETLSRWYH